MAMKSTSPRWGGLRAGIWTNNLDGILKGGDFWKTVNWMTEKKLAK
jgi:hypothetical protein